MDKELLERLVKLETLLKNLRDNNIKSHKNLKEDLVFIREHCQELSKENELAIDSLAQRTSKLEKQSTVTVVRWKTLQWLTASFSTVLISVLVQYLFKVFF